MNREEISKLLKNETIRKSILTTLAQNNDPEIIQEIIQLFDDDDIEIRGEVFSTLFLNENDILKDLIRGLNHESKNVRAYTALVLANRNEKNAIEEIRKLTNDSSGLVRTCAYGALGHLEAKESSKELHRGIFDSNLEAVKSAAYALTRIEEIIKLTNDSSGLVRTCAYGALGHLEAKQSAKELHKGIFDSNLEAVKSAAYSLTRIKEKISDKELEELHKLDEPEFDRILKFFN